MRADRCRSGAQSRQEASVASSYHTLARCPDSDREQLPIGVACGEAELFILDDEGEPVRDGTRGHLFIGGGGLSPGYWQDPGQTRGSFVPRPAAAGTGGVLYRTGELARREANGLVYLHGRHDDRRT